MKIKMDEPLVAKSPQTAHVTPFLALAIFVAVLGGTFQFGYNLGRSSATHSTRARNDNSHGVVSGVINSPQDAIEYSLSGCNASQVAMLHQPIGLLVGLQVEACIDATW